jgi:hypothetical protein
MIDGANALVVRERESFDDLVRLERLQNDKAIIG